MQEKQLRPLAQQLVEIAGALVPNERGCVARPEAKLNLVNVRFLQLHAEGLGNGRQSACEEAREERDAVMSRTKARATWGRELNIGADVDIMSQSGP